MVTEAINATFNFTLGSCFILFILSIMFFGIWTLSYWESRETLCKLRSETTFIFLSSLLRTLAVIIFLGFCTHSLFNDDYPDDFAEWEQEFQRQIEKDDKALEEDEETKKN